MLESEVDQGINVCCVIADSLRLDVFTDAKPLNILKLGRVQKAYSISNSTVPAIHGYLMNYPPIGVGVGLFVKSPMKAPDAITAKYRKWLELRKWMPRYFRERGYFTIWMSANPTPIQMDRELNGIYRKHFNHWGAEAYLERDVGELYGLSSSATPQIIKDLALHVKINSSQPIFAVILLMDTHSPYHDGEGTTHPIDPSQPSLNYKNQVKAMQYIDNIFPNFINIFSKTERPTEFIFMSDHGENFDGPGWGHNNFRPALQFGEKLFAIPFVRGRIEDWSRYKVHMLEDLPT